MARFTVTFEVDNGAFKGERLADEVAATLRRVARYRQSSAEYPLEVGVGETGRVLDSNGTTVGNWEYSPEDGA